MFRISRIRSVQVLDQSARRPLDFDLAAYWKAWLADSDAGGARAD